MASCVRLCNATHPARGVSIGNPHHIETCSHYASMRQIHAAIEHWRRSDFECAMTLAGAAEGMLPDIDEPCYRELQDFTRVNEISNWLMSGSGERMKGDHVDTVIIGELDAIVAIHRAILKFEAVFWQDKTPQMTSFRNCAHTRILVKSQET